jgi:hypothetical protein
VVYSTQYSWMVELGSWNNIIKMLYSSARVVDTRSGVATFGEALSEKYSSTVRTRVLVYSIQMGQILPIFHGTPRTWRFNWLQRQLWSWYHTYCNWIVNMMRFNLWNANSNNAIRYTRVVCIRYSYSAYVPLYSSSKQATITTVNRSTEVSSQQPQRRL